MTTQQQLKATPRNIFGRKVKQIRSQGLVPANIYGSNVESFSIQTPIRELRLLLADTGESEIIDLSIEGEKETRPVLLHGVQRDPVTQEIIHVDFRQVDMSQEVTVEVTLVFTGEPTIVKNGEGILLELVDSLEVTALPGNLPSEIEIDVSGLESIGAQLTVGDLTLPEGIEVNEEEDLPVAKIDEARIEEPEEEPEILEGEEGQTPETEETVEREEEETTEATEEEE